MESQLKTLLSSLRPRRTKELVGEHVRKVEVDPKNSVATLHVDKRYAFNTLISHDHIGGVIRGVKRAFGGRFGTVVKLDAGSFPPERERIVLHPHAVQYR